MKKILVSGSIIFLFLVSFAWADVSITLRDGTSFVVDSISFSDDQVHLPDGRILSRDDVAQILYLKGKKGWTYTPDSPDLDEYKNYLLKGKQLAKRYPGHPFYSVEDDNLFQVNPDGTHFYSSRSIYYIATEDGLRLSSQNFWITEARERMDFHALRFISKHIKISDAAPENIAIAQTNTQTRHFSRGKTVSVRIPDVQVGGLIEVFSTTDTYNPFDPKIWDARNYFQSMVPTARSVITVRAPKKMKINFYPSNLPPDKSKPIVRKVGKFKEYRWETGEMPAFLPEPNMPPYGDLVPMVIISPFFDWDVLFDFQQSVIGGKTVPDETVKMTTINLIAGAKSDEEKIARIYHFIQKNIRYISIKGSIGSGWGGHPAWLTLKNRYGDCVDKAILMTAMLSVCNIDAEVAIIYTNSNSQKMGKIPASNANHAITRITLNGRSFYLDSTASTYRYPYFRSDDHGSVAMLAKSGKIERITPPPPSSNRKRWEYRIKMDEDGALDVVRQASATGPAEALWRSYITGEKEKERREHLSQVALNLSPQGRLDWFIDKNVDDLSLPLILQAAFILPDYVKKTGTYRFFKLPGVEMKFKEIALPERKLDLFIPSANSEEKIYEVEIPKNLKPASLPKPLEIKTPWYEVNAQYKLEDSKIMFKFRFDMQQGIIPVSDYPKVREDLLQVEKYCDQSLFLVSQEGGAL